MRFQCLLRTLFLVWTCLFLGALSSAGTVQASAIFSPKSVWGAEFVQPEKEIAALHQDLGKVEEELKKVMAEVHSLQEKITALRKEAGKEPGLFAEMRLKILLNDLKPRLEWKSLLERQDREKHRNFEEKTSSLLSMYNAKIENELKPLDSPGSLEDEISHLQVLAQKRGSLRKLVAEHAEPLEPEKTGNTTKFENLTSVASPGLHMTLNLLEDQRKDLQARLEKNRLQEEEIQNEIKLQGKMKDFVDGIQKMNENSDFPRFSLKRSDLENMSGQDQVVILEKKFMELQAQRQRDEKSLRQVEDLILKVKRRVESPAEEGRAGP